MATDLVAPILRSYRQLRERAVALAADLTDEQLGRGAGGSTNAVGWNLWHVARWADIFQFEMATVNAEVRGRVGPPRHIWAEERLAERWALPTQALGFWEANPPAALGAVDTTGMRFFCVDGASI